MSQIPSLAVVLEGGLVRSTLVQGWPDSVPLPRIVIVDYDIDGADEDDLMHFSIGNSPTTARCHSEIPGRYEDFSTALSPKDVLAALGETVDAGPPEPRGKTPVEQSLTDTLTGYVRHDPVLREQVRNTPDWPGLARRELARRRARFLEILPDDELQAIARGEVDLAELADRIPG
jgi:hypothetical protein